MQLLLQPLEKTPLSTVSNLFVDGMWECFILEDTVREEAGRPVSSWKVAGVTAIPSGRYRIDITDSARFGRKLPLLVDVPGYSGVRIHPGNGPENTEGCLLPGKSHGSNKVGNSRDAFNKLYETLLAAHDAGEEIWIEVKR